MQVLRKIHALRLVAVCAVLVLMGCGSTQQSVSDYDMQRQTALDTVKAQRFDGGKMWTFDYPPLDYFQEEYQFRPDQRWLDNVRMSALRFATYCSASFVSEDGLVMTNHHCGREAVAAVSREGENLGRDGYVAAKLEDERKDASLFVEQLHEIRDISPEVFTAMDRETTDEAKLKARDSISDVIEKRIGEETKMRCQIVSFFNGGKFSAYIYKRYDDVRLVFSPELSLGFFGGDDDNFTFPRYTLDCNFFRVYDENGKPLKTKSHFKWSKAGAAENEPVFVVGNPGSTSRLSTTAQLEYNRDYYFPFVTGLLNGQVDVLHAYAESHPDKREKMINEIFNMANSQKAFQGQLTGLQNDILLQRRRDFDKKFREAVESKPQLKQKYGHLWDDIAGDRQKMRAIAPDLYSLRSGGLLVSSYYSKAASLARYAHEMGKPEADRDKNYQGKAAELTMRNLGKMKAPDMEMERLTLVKQLGMWKQMLPKDDPLLVMALKGQTPEQAAQRLLSESILTDTARLAALAQGGVESINASTDPFIQLARIAVPRAIKARDVSNELSARDEVNNGLLGRAMFEVYGTSIPPDATFTLRLADGRVKGYSYNGTRAPIYTTYYGMYDRHHSFVGKEAWELPERWVNPPQEFDLSTPLNFVSTNDIIGGNSGSPIINKSMEVVGLVFDGNMESLPGEFIFAEDMGNRTISVHSSGMLQAIRHIYKLERLAKELETGKMPD